MVGASGLDSYRVGDQIHSLLSRIFVWCWLTYAPLSFAIWFRARTRTSWIVHWVWSDWFTLEQWRS